MPGDTDASPIDQGALFTALAEFVEAYCEATGTDRGSLDRTVVVVDLTDAEGHALGMTFDLSMKPKPGALYDSTPADELREQIEQADATQPQTPTTKES
jgi:hypothetical protein